LPRALARGSLKTNSGLLAHNFYLIWEGTSSLIIKIYFKMKIAKEFRWEMGHRLPYHNGLCKNVHGHSYQMVIELEGDVNTKGMIIDFYDLGEIIDSHYRKIWTMHSFAGKKIKS